jgi:hypothetical protein
MPCTGLFVAFIIIFIYKKQALTFPKKSMRQISGKQLPRGWRFEDGRHSVSAEPHGTRRFGNCLKLLKDFCDERRQERYRFYFGGK